jgi:hypothetical protein
MKWTSADKDSPVISTSTGTGSLPAFFLSFSHLDGMHPGLVGHVLGRDGLPAGPGRAHANTAAASMVLTHLRILNSKSK